MQVRGADCPTGKGNFGGGEFVAYLCENMSSDRVAIWGNKWNWTNKQCVRWGFLTPVGKAFRGFVAHWL